MKNCEVCQKEIPDDFVNLLCPEHYEALVAENLRQEEQQAAEKPKVEPEVSVAQETPILTSTERMDDLGVTLLNQPTNGITDPNYQENPEATDKEQWHANIKLFERNGVLLWKPTKGMYNYIRQWCLDRVTAHPQYPKFIWKPKIVDVGCGIGVGSNILSNEADFVWGIDKNANSVRFAKEAFERVKNGIYYSSQVSFDVIDMITDSREFMKFDVVVAIEIIEHIADYKTFLKNLTRFDKRYPEDPTVYFISTPNRNNKSIHKDKPYNPYHVREWTSEEFHTVLSEFFQNVEFMSSAGVPTERTTDHTPLLARCWGLKL